AALPAAGGYQSTACSKGRRRVSGLLFLPILAKHLAEPTILPLSFTKDLLAAHADGPVPTAFEGFPACFVFGVDLGHELVQVELAKRITSAELHRLGREAFAPRRLLADDDPGGPVRVEPVDAVDPGRADRLALGFDDPPHVVLRFADL